MRLLKPRTSANSRKHQQRGWWQYHRHHPNSFSKNSFLVRGVTLLMLAITLSIIFKSANVTKHIAFSSTLDEVAFSLPSKRGRSNSSNQKKTCIMIRTTFPFPWYAYKQMEHFAYGIASLDLEDEFDVVVRVDETEIQRKEDATAGSQSPQKVLDEHFESLTTQSNNPKEQYVHVEVSSVTLDTLLNYFHPTLEQYLFNGSNVNTNGGNGDCCRRPPMWQLATPNDVHFVIENQDRYDDVWIVEDDIDIIGTIPIIRTTTNSSSSSVSSSSSASNLVELLTMKNQALVDEQKHAPFVAVLSRNVDPWMADRHTKQFQPLVDRFQHRYERKAISDAIRRISVPAAQVLNDAIVDRYQFAHIEAFSFPVLVNHSISGADPIILYWWDDLPRIGNLVYKKDEQEAQAFMNHQGLTGAVYQIRRKPMRNIVFTFSSFNKEEQTWLFLKSFQTHQKEMGDAELYILTDVLPNDSNLLPWKDLLNRMNATVVHAGYIFDSVRKRVPGIAHFNPMKIFVLNEWLHSSEGKVVDEADSNLLVVDEDVVFRNGKIFSAFGAYDMYNKLLFGERKGLSANFNSWCQNCWDHTTHNKTIHELAKSWQMYNSGVILVRGIAALKEVYSKWSYEMEQFGSPKCDQIFLNYLIQSKKAFRQIRLVKDDEEHNDWVMHLTTQHDRYKAFKRKSVSLVHQWRWCKECTADMKRDLGWETATQKHDSTFKDVEDVSVERMNKITSVSSAGNATTMTDDGSFGVVLIALGPKISNNTLVERCIHSLRRRGTFHGRVGVITDAPEGRFSNLKNRDPMVSILPVNFERVGNIRFSAWRYKSLILDILDKDPHVKDDEFQQILYMDVDVLAGQELQPFMEYVGEKIQNAVARESSLAQSMMLMFEDQGKGKETLQKWRQDENKTHVDLTMWHAGVIVLSRQRSRGCLNIWNQLIVSKKFKDDQIALVHMQENPEIRKQCELVEMNPKFFHFPDKESMEAGKTATLVHLTISRRAVLIPDNLQESYMRDVLQLDDEFSLALCGKWGTC